MNDWSLARVVTAFVQQLRHAGVTVSPAESADALAALARTPMQPRADFARLLRACLAKTPEDRARFDTVFAEFFDARPTEVAEQADADDDQTGNQKAHGVGDAEPAPAKTTTSDSDPSENANTGASAARQAMQTDLAAIGADEREAMERLIRTLGHQLARRAARRWRARSQGVIDLRRSLRAAIAHGGEVFKLRRRYRPRERPRLVVFADVSYSMDAYSRFFLCFIHAFARVFRAVESYVFSTQLSRVTETLARSASVEAGLARLPECVEDWAGGTRIASALETFMHRFADQQLDRNTVVMIVSDGWDSDKPERLQAVLKRLRGRCRAIIWLDPLMGHPRFFSTALGAQHESPHVDICAPARNLAGLEALVERLSRARIV
ncbi:VWA containing CoxE family protein [Salinisphaera sp. T5B8]|uniref:vWA domain-containing protein n=1 Tax=Salinisphaera sp. T5B8 TaxID=1304154 RepID=UPI0033402F20